MFGRNSAKFDGRRNNAYCNSFKINNFGSSGGTRTPNLSVNSRMLPVDVCGEPDLHRKIVICPAIHWPRATSTVAEVSREDEPSLCDCPYKLACPIICTGGI